MLAYRVLGNLLVVRPLNLKTLLANSLIYKYFTGKSLLLKDLGEDNR